VNAVVVDANVWLAAIDGTSPHRDASRACLERLRTLGWQVSVPAPARVEIACALARRLRNPARARRITESLLALAEVRETALDLAALERALVLGTERYLRGLDAFYAADAVSEGIPLLSWDGELCERVRATTPAQWLGALRV
jgi:predicted nucleic acid-binding protein